MQAEIIAVPNINLIWEKIKNREKPPLEKILDLCHDIRHNSYGFKNLYSEVEVAKQRAESTKNLYDQIVMLVPQVETKDYMLLNGILRILCIDNAPVYSDALYAIKCDNGETLGHNLRYNNFDILAKFDAYLHDLYEKEYAAEIAKLEKKGISICKGWYRQYYSEHIFDMNLYEWRKIFDYEWEQIHIDTNSNSNGFFLSYQYKNGRNTYTRS